MNKIIFSFILIVSSLWGGYKAPLNIKGSTTIDTKQAYELYNKKVMFIDVRPSWMVQKQGKIKGAFNYYVGDFNANGLKMILSTKNIPVVIYCNGIGCSLSEEAIVKMAPLGYKNIYFYRDGYPAWKHYKLPTK
ncbi:MAG: rhodanese-like domain-containing protein [Arcobacteraceae bacterium]|nr:rhodanese-like domain-containing protein [Arcobacteraceae bacterium]